MCTGMKNATKKADILYHKIKKVISKMFVCENSECNKKHELQPNNKIIYYEDNDWKFSIETEDGRIEDFFIHWDNSGDKWISLYFVDDDIFRALEFHIHQDPETSIIDNNTKWDLDIAYSRRGNAFGLLYRKYPDPWIDGWIENPYIIFPFVEKEHPNFEVYAMEVLRIQDFLLAERKRKRG